MPIYGKITKKSMGIRLYRPNRDILDFHKNCDKVTPNPTFENFVQIVRLGNFWIEFFKFRFGVVLIFGIASGDTFRNLCVQCTLFVIWERKLIVG